MIFDPKDVGVIFFDIFDPSPIPPPPPLPPSKAELQQNGGNFAIGKVVVALLLKLAFGNNFSMSLTNEGKPPGGSKSPPM